MLEPVIRIIKGLIEMIKAIGEIQTKKITEKK